MGAHNRCFPGREKWPWWALPRGTRLGTVKEEPPTPGGASAESPEAPTWPLGQRRPLQRTGLPSCLLGPSAAWKNSRKEPCTRSQAARAPAPPPALWPQCPCGYSGAGSRKEARQCSLTAAPPTPALSPGVIFLPAAAAQTPLNLYFETGYFSLSGEGCQVIGPV